MLGGCSTPVILRMLTFSMRKVLDDRHFHECPFCKVKGSLGADLKFKLPPLEELWGIINREDPRIIPTLYINDDVLNASLSLDFTL